MQFHISTLYFFNLVMKPMNDSNVIRDSPDAASDIQSIVVEFGSNNRCYKCVDQMQLVLDGPYRLISSLQNHSDTSGSFPQHRL